MSQLTVIKSTEARTETDSVFMQQVRGFTFTQIISGRDSHEADYQDLVKPATRAMIYDIRHLFTAIGFQTGGSGQQTCKNIGNGELYVQKRNNTQNNKQNTDYTKQKTHAKRDNKYKIILET